MPTIETQLMKRQAVILRNKWKFKLEQNPDHNQNCSYTARAEEEYCSQATVS